MSLSVFLPRFPFCFFFSFLYYFLSFTLSLALSFTCSFIALFIREWGSLGWLLLLTVWCFVNIILLYPSRGTLPMDFLSVLAYVHGSFASLGPHLEFQSSKTCTKPKSDLYSLSQLYTRVTMKSVVEWKWNITLEIIIVWGEVIYARLLGPLFCCPSVMY